MSEIQGIGIIRWQNGLMDGGNNHGQGYAPTYLRTVNNQLSAISNHAARYYGFHPNPAAHTVKMGGKETSEMRFWAKGEYLKFADEMMERPREFLMFEILHWIGIREGGCSRSCRRHSTSSVGLCASISRTSASTAGTS